MKRSGFILTTLGLLVVMAFSFIVADGDSVAGRRSLDLFSPLIDHLSSLGERFSVRGHPWFAYVTAALGVGVFTLAASLWREGGKLLLLASFIGVLAQLFLIDQQLWVSLTISVNNWLGLAPIATAPQGNPPYAKVGLTIGVVLYGLSLLVALLALRREDRETVFNLGKVSGSLFSWCDAVILSVVFLVGLLLRTYALNQIVNGFEGELSPYSAGATSLKGMLLANRGTNGPWSPLGILYYLPIYLTTSIFGSTLHALRLSSVLVGALTVPLVYLLAARVAGRAAGHIAAALFALNCLHIGWSRTDIHPHGVTTWPTLLLCWALIKAYDTRKLSWGCAVALLMGLTWHQYPSGQSAVAIPLVALGLYWLCNRCRMALTWPQTALVGVGVLLWGVGLPVSYYLADGRWFFNNPFTLTGPRALWSGDIGAGSPVMAALGVISTACRQLIDVFMGVFYRQPYFFHQEWVPYAEGFNARTVPWLEAPFVVLGFVLLCKYRRRFEVAVMLAWIVAGIMPGILSEHAYPKRLSTVFPALDIIAAIALATLLSCVAPTRRRIRFALASLMIVVTLLGYAAFLSNVWFGGRFWKYGEPHEIQMARQFSDLISPGTIVVADLNISYGGGKYLYLMLDHLHAPSNRPNVFALASTPAMQSLIAEPLRAPTYALDTLAYLWTKMRAQRQEIAAYNDWRKVVFAIQLVNNAAPESSQWFSSIMARCESPKTLNIEARGTAYVALFLVECDLDRLKSSE